MHTYRLVLVRYMLLFLLLSLPTLLIAQITVRGEVLNASNSQPIEGALITANTGEQTTTLASGAYRLMVPASTKFLLVTHVGFAPDTVRMAAAGKVEPIRTLLQPDAAVLQEVEVTGFETNRPLLQTAGAISVVPAEIIQRFDGSSVVRAVNLMPGVRMDERAPASYRISIRGSTLRSPYGIRNVKLYFNGFPLTEANGTTALNMLDAATMGNIEILKGPTASVYGAGTGGTILLEPKLPQAGTVAQAGAAVGSYGYKHYTASFSSGTAKAKTLVQYNRQQYDGYREQSAVDRHVLLLTSELLASEKRTVATNIIYTNLYYELPGALTLEQYQQNPRQARGGKFGSVTQHASVQQEGINIGLKQNYTFSDAWQNTTAVYGLHRFKDNPFNTDYERNTNQEIGGRSSFVHNSHIGSQVVTYTFGGEFQRGFEAARTYDNNAGTPDSLRTDDEVIAKTGFVFAQAALELPAAIIATAALSLNDTQYGITRLHQPAGAVPVKLVRDFNTVLSPRVALLKQLTNQISVHASVSAGFSPPTEEEILTSDGSLNTKLEAEKGVSYEAGARGFAYAGKLRFDVVGFYFRLRETIVSSQEVSSVAVFRNVGSTSQAGLETSFSYLLVDAPAMPLQLLKVWGSYTYNHFRFQNYRKGEADLSGHSLTGTSPHTASLALDVKTKPGFYFNLTTNYVASTPLNDENTVYAQKYIVAGAQLGWRKQVAKQLHLEAKAGVDNLTNEKYSLGNDLNAFGARYFQPAPERNYYGGLTIRYSL